MSVFKRPGQFTSLGKRVCLGIAGALAAAALVSCGRSASQVNAAGSAPANSVTVAVVKAARKNLEQHLTVSSELVPLQEIDVYAKESGFVKKLDVDYGSHVKTDQVMAVLEIPELKVQLDQDEAAIQAADDQIKRLGRVVDQNKAQASVAHLQYDRILQVSKKQPGLVAQQEVDDWQGRDLAAQAQVEAAEANLEVAQSQADQARAKKMRDGVLYDYRNITAPFEGVVTQRYANYGTLMQAGTSSSTSVLPLVRLSEDDQFRLVIPVEESYVSYIHIGDPVSVEIPSLNRTFPGKIARFSDEVSPSTRTMHTEVQVANDAARSLKAGVYVNATIRLAQISGAVAIPLEAVDRQGDNITVDVVGDGNRIELRKVTTGIETADSMEIRSGVKDGEMVVVGDRSGLKAGDTVVPKPRELNPGQQ